MPGITLNQLKAISLRAAQRPVNRVLYNQDGDLLFTAGTDGCVAVWNSQTGERLGTYHYIPKNPHNVTVDDITRETADRTVDDLSVKRDSSELATASFDTVVIYEVGTGRFLDVIQEVAKVVAVEFNQNPVRQDKLLVAHTAFGGPTPTIPAFKIYATSQPEMPEPGKSRQWDLVQEVTDFEGMPTVARWGPMDMTFIGGNDAGKIYQWDLEGNQVCSVKAHDESVTSISFNRARTLMLTTSRDQTACLWQVPDFQLVKRYTVDRPLDSGAISPLLDVADADKRKPHMLLAGGQAAAEVTTTAAGEGKFETLLMNMIYESEIGRFLAHYSPTRCVAFAPDGGSFATGALEGNVKIHKFDESFMEMNHNQ